MLGLTSHELEAVQAGPKQLANALAILQHMSKSKGETCSECLAQLDASITHERFYELARAGLLTHTGQRRTTSQGGVAKVYIAVKKPDFKEYIRFAQTKRTKTNPALTPEEQAILQHGKTFIKRWRKARSLRGREQAATDLITALAGVADKR